MKRMVKTGDITKDVETEAIATLINSFGAWFGEVDLAIKLVAGGLYHDQPASMLKRLGLKDGLVFVAEGTRSLHDGNFDNVIFIVDDFKQSLRKLVYLALETAEDEGFGNLALPLMRTGVAAGQVEKTLDEVVQEIHAGVQLFAFEYPESELELTMVVYNNPNAVQLLMDHHFLEN